MGVCVCLGGRGGGRVVCVCGWVGGGCLWCILLATAAFSALSLCNAAYTYVGVGMGVGVGVGVSVGVGVNV